MPSSSSKPRLWTHRRTRRWFVALLCLSAPVAGVWWLRHPRSSKSDLPTLELRRRSASTSPGPPIRVGLTPDPVTSVKISVTGPFEVRSLGSAQSLLRADNLAETSVTTTSRGFRIGSRELSASQVEFVPQNMPGVWINDHQYRGTVRLYRRSGNKIVAVNVLPLEEYVASVVDSEMPAEFGAEARKAQAIVARTYALYQKRSAASGSVVDLYATVRSQKYLGVQYRSGGRSLAGESAGSREVTAETKGQVCTTGGQLCGRRSERWDTEIDPFASHRWARPHAAVRSSGRCGYLPPDRGEHARRPGTVWCPQSAIYRRRTRWIAASSWIG